MPRRQDEIASQENNQLERREDHGRLGPKELPKARTLRVRQKKSPEREDPGEIRIPRQVAGSYVAATGPWDSQCCAASLIRRRKASVPKSNTACISSPGPAEITCVARAWYRL